jgi:inorganic pyrophosphatase
MHLWHDVSLGKNAPKEITVVIEIPKGSQNKYEIDKETGLISLDRVLYGANFYPMDYGFVPQTLWEDGDALDAFVLTTNELFPGCLVKARPIGIIKMIDDGESDDKLICVPVNDPRFNEVNDLADISEHQVKEMTHFLETYKLLQDKEVTISGARGVEAAHEAVKKGVKLYQQKFSA